MESNNGCELRHGCEFCFFFVKQICVGAGLSATVHMAYISGTLLMEEIQSGYRCVLTGKATRRRILMRTVLIRKLNFHFQSLKCPHSDLLLLNVSSLV